MKCFHYLFTVLALFFCIFIMPISTQVSWTPIYVDGKSQVDLWTQESKGCRCSYDETNKDCACCVKDGACHCGRASPNRCTQCGLEQHCSNMCNVTLDSRYLTSRSGKTFGQIKSPSMQGPGFCWYLLKPDTGQRVEIQVYRLVSCGRFNGTGCEAGSLQLIDGTEFKVPANGTSICGSNERYSPPVVLFSDNRAASLLFHVGEPTLRSQFLAYFSFTSISSGQGPGFQLKGGRRIEKSVCDWLYQDFSCREPTSCVLGSPGYPGLYPPNRRCRYHVTTSSIHTQIHITFKSLLLPHNRCATDFIAIYQGTTPSSQLLTTVCNKRKAQFHYSGPDLLIEFNSGPSLPPYDYNGFMATLQFTEKSTSTESSLATTKSTESGVMMDGTSAPNHIGSRSNCHTAFSGNDTRSGHFDTRHMAWNSICTITFRGRTNDVVHVSLFNYKLKEPSCQSTIEVYHDIYERGMKPSNRICSPVTKHARDPSGKFVTQQTFVSSDNVLTVLVKRMHQPPSSSSSSSSEFEFMDGAFLFHDEQIDGTLQPVTLCDVDFYGLSSPKEGRITNSGTENLFWNIEGPLRCSQRFVPAVNQSITIAVTHLSKLVADSNCHTQCGDGGCLCVTSSLPLSEMDHLMLITDSGQVLACLCGNFQQEWLPVSVRSWSPVRVLYSVAHYSWTLKGFTFTASYTFNTDSVCGSNIITQTSGDIRSRTLTTAKNKLNHFFHLDCTWLLDSKIERQLTVEVETDQSRPCVAWNISVHRYETTKSDNVGETLHTFCPRDRNKSFSLPWKINIILLRLRATTRILPEYGVRWSSQIIYANTRVSGPTSSPSINTGYRIHPVTLRVTILLFTWVFRHIT